MSTLASDSMHDSLALPEDPQELAELTAKTMYDNDPASQALGARVVGVAPGQASMSMTVRADMLNGHKTCRGGFIFALADSTFAFPRNSLNAAPAASGRTIHSLASTEERRVGTASESKGESRVLADH